MRLGLVGTLGRPAVARVVVERVLYVPVVAVLLLVRHRVGDGVVDEDVADLVIAAGADLQFEVGELEFAVLAAGEAAAGVRGVREDFQTQAGDAFEAIMADDPVFVLVGMRAGGLDGAVGFLFEHGAFGGLERGGFDHLPGLPPCGDFGLTLSEPANEGGFRFLAG